jgi:hypothetical protein
MNRHSKGLIHYPTEDKGGGSHSSLPHFTNILGQTISNMTALKNFNEKSVADMVSNQEAVTKLQAGLFDKIEGMNLYLGAYEEDKKYVNSVTSAYVEKLKEIAANPQDPFAKMKVAQLGFEMTQDLTAGNLGKIAENAKVHMARLQDLEQNKGVLSVDPNAKNDYDDDNKDFKGTIKTDKNGNITHHSLKYVPISAPLDHQKGLKEHMDNRKDSSLPVAEPFRVVTLEGDPNRTHVLNTTMIGVDEATAYNDAKGYFDKVSSSGEDRRRLVKEFEKKAKEGPDGKYFETKDKEGNPIKLSLDEFIDARNTERALQNYGQFVHKKVSQSLGQTDDPEQRALATEHKKNALYLQGLSAQKMQQAMNIATRNAQLREEAAQRAIEAHELRKQAKSANIPLAVANGDQIGEGYLPQGDYEEDKRAIKFITPNAVKRLSATNNKEYNKLADQYDAIFDDRNKLYEIAGHVINDSTLMNFPKLNREKFVKQLLLLQSDSRFRNSDAEGKATIMRQILGTGVTLPAIKNIKPTYRMGPDGRSSTPAKTYDPLVPIIAELERNAKFTYNGKSVNAPELFRAEIARGIDTKNTYPIYLPLDDKAFNTSVVEPLARQAYVKLSNSLNLSKDQFYEAVKDGQIVFEDDNKISFKIKEKIDKKPEEGGDEYKDKVYTITDPESWRKYGAAFAKTAYRQSAKESKTGGDAKYLDPLVQHIISDKDKLRDYDQFIKGTKDITRFVLGNLVFYNVTDSKGLDFHLQGLSENDKKEIMEKLKQSKVFDSNGKIIKHFLFIDDNEKGIDVVPYDTDREKVNAVNESIVLYNGK